MKKVISLILFVVAVSVFAVEIEPVKIALHEINTPQVGVDDLDLPTVETVDINNDVVDDLLKIHAKSKFLSRPNLNFGDDVENWATLLVKYQEIDDIEYIEIDREMRMIAEVTLPKSKDEFENTYSNLKSYKEKGYNSVLLSFDGTEEIAKLKHFVNRIKKIGFEVYFTFGYYEKSKFELPEARKYTKILKGLAPLSKGFLLNWRRTSNHMFYSSSDWYNMNMSILREANPNIIILGEVYYGNNVESRGIYSIVSNLPNNISGAVLVNFGYDGINIEKLLTNYLPKKLKIEVPLIGVVIRGDKDRIEERFFNIGNGVITLADTSLSPSSINEIINN